MPNIDDLAQTSALTGGHEVAVYLPEQRSTRKATLDQVTDYVQSAIEGEPDDTLYSLNGTTVTALPAAPGGSSWAQITLSAPAPALTIILPGVDDRAHGQEVLVTCTQPVTTLTINGNGAATAGAPGALTANGFFRLRFDSVSATWYRIG